MAAVVKGNIETSKTAFFLCDVQERFKPVIKYFNDIEEVCKRLVLGAKALDIPVVVTEQYPKGLGSTVQVLKDVLDTGDGGVKIFPKTKFSMLIPEVQEHLKSLCGGEVNHVVLFGIESHVCVQQTALDLMKIGIQVFVVADGVSSRSQVDRHFALDRLRQAGAIVTTCENVLLQLVGDKDHEKFKAVQGLIKATPEQGGLLPKCLM